MKKEIKRELEDRGLRIADLARSLAGDYGVSVKSADNMLRDLIAIADTLNVVRTLATALEKIVHLDCTDLARKGRLAHYIALRALAEAERISSDGLDLVGNDNVLQPGNFECCGSGNGFHLGNCSGPKPSAPAGAVLDSPDSPDSPDSKPVKYAGDLVVATDYWDCECRENYIHPKTVTFCASCQTPSDDRPSSRFDEVRDMLKQEEH